MPRSAQQAKTHRLDRGVAACVPLLCVLLLCVLLLCAVPLGVHALKYPDFSGFWAGVDQQRYLAAARGWAAGDFTPARHHYPAFYPLMGAAFVWLTPWQPFLLPDMACLLASLALFLRIGRRLAPDWPAGVLAGCFTLAVFSGRSDAAIWVVPWSTTGAAPFQFAAVLLALRFGERPGAGRAGWFALVAALIAGFRPSDAAILLIAGGLHAGWALLRRAAPMRLWAACGLAGGLGAAAGLLPVLAAHVAIFGWATGSYVAESAAIGFEWRLLPLRWVMIVVGARPILPDGMGLAVGLPWLAFGLAGLFLALLRARRGGAAAVLVAGTVALHWAAYLAYRDLQPAGLWRFYNLHYFKWTFPFLVLWAAQWLWALRARRSWLPAFAAGVAAAFCLAWRPVLRSATPLSVTVADRTLGFSLTGIGPGRALRLPLRAGWNDLYFGAATLRVGGREFIPKRDFRLQPAPTGALLLPLRPFPAGAATLRLPPGVGYDRAQPAQVVRQGVVFGL